MSSSAPTAALGTSAQKVHCVAATIMAIAFLALGSMLIGAGGIALWAHISTQIVFNPLHRTMSVLLTTPELGGMLLIVGAWVAWTGHLLWSGKRLGYRSATGILAVLFVRGALALLPPIEEGYVAFGLSLMLVALAGTVLLWYSRPALRAK